MALTRRNFVRAAGLAGAAGSGALLAGCARGAADSGANEPAAAGAAGAGVGPDGVSQVVITMTPSSEPAAGFDPLVGWGAGRARARAAHPIDAHRHGQQPRLRERSRHR